MRPNITTIIPVFRDADGGILAAHLVKKSIGGAGGLVEILLIDDGSGDDTAERLESGIPPGAVLLRLNRNRGRSGARNAGAEAASGDVLLFIDSDCRPADDGLISAHLRRIEAGAIASTGPVVGTGCGFWNQFQVDSSRRRAALHARGVTYSGSTQNLMVQRDAFEAVGGFDEGYLGYGFEDRDLLIRLAESGLVAWADDAVVEHHDDLDLATVCRKMREAGAGSSQRFSKQHPQAYRALGYAALDAGLHPWRGRVACILSPLLPLAINATSTFLESDLIPFKLRSLAVRVLSGVSFLFGTHEASS